MSIQTLSDLVYNVIQEKLQGKASKELIEYKSLGMNETIGPEGGYATTDQMIDEILASFNKVGCGAYAKAKKINVTKGSGVVMPFVTEANTTSAVTVYWPGEGCQKNSTLPHFDMRRGSLNTVSGLIHITEELMEDKQQLVSWLQQIMPQFFVNEIENRMFNGAGATSMIGIMDGAAPGVIGVAVADPVDLATLKNYEKAIAPRSTKQAEFYVSKEDYNDIIDMMDCTNTCGEIITFRDEQMHIYGHPVNQVDFLVAGTSPVLADFTQYVVVQRGMKFVDSINFKFDLDERSLKWTMRLNGTSYGNIYTLNDGVQVAPFIVPSTSPVAESSSSSSSSSSDSSTSESSQSNSSSSKSLSSASSKSLSSASSQSQSSASSASQSSESSTSVEFSSGSSTSVSSDSSESSLDITSESSPSSTSMSSLSSVEYSSNSSSSSESGTCPRYVCGDWNQAIVGADGTYVHTGEFGSGKAYTNGTYWIWYDITTTYWALSGDKGDPQNQWESSIDTAAAACPSDDIWVNADGTVTAGQC